MSGFIVRLGHDGGAVNCALCAEAVPDLDGPLLCQRDSAAPVCRSCGRRHAPALAALLDLARVACRVGKISRHSGAWAPIELLLQLERVASDYAALVVGGKAT